MMRSLYSGVSGLKTHQTRMDVIGNNIANVNTTAYKSQSITFSELMYQTTQKASGPSATSGTAGTNARQIGLGVKSGAISTAISTSGATQTTGNPFDLRITGDSFFIVSNGKDNFFTRDGSFYVDAVGNLAMSSNGYNVMGWGVDQETMSIKKDTVQPLRIMGADNKTYPPEATSKALVSGIIDKRDKQVADATEGKIMNLNFYDNLGYPYTAKLSVKADPANEGVYDVSIAKVLDDTGKEIDSSGFTFSAKLEYDTATGLLKKVNGSEDNFVVNFDFGAANTIPQGPFATIAVDFSETSNFDNNGTSTISADPGDLKGLGVGRKLGEMSGVSIQKDGMIYASYDNGQTRLLGQIAVAEFSNAMGLEKEGDNLYSATLNSGEFDGIGVDITANGGYMETGVLEMSNVDLSAEFTDMITAQRGFQANSRIITVSDTLLEELVNLKR